MAGLPEGLVTNSDAITQEIDNVEYLDVEDIIRLWKAYSNSKAPFADGAGRRLDNFFWRIWGSKGFETITGSQISSLFHTISEEGPLRTTPTQSPRTSRHIGSYRPAHNSAKECQDIKDENQRNRAAKEPTSVDVNMCVYSQGAQENGSSSTQSSLAGFSDNEYKREASGPVQRPSSTYASATDKMAHGQAQQVESQWTGDIDQDDGDERTPTATPPKTQRADKQIPQVGSAESSSALRAISSQDTIKAGQESIRKAARRRGGHPAHTTATRKRPVTMRRKSSQTQPSGAQAINSPPMPKSGSVNRGLSTSIEQLNEGSRDSSVTSSTLFVDLAEVPPSLESSSSTLGHSTSDSDRKPHQHQSTLVEPDFRNKFVAKTRSAQSSFVSLPSLLRTPSSTTAASASYQASGTFGPEMQPAGRVRNRVTFSDEVTTSEQPPLTDLAEAPNEEAQALPRTRSHLTMLLERNQLRASGNEKGEKDPRKPSR